MRKELETKIMKAKDTEEVKAVLSESGEKISDSDAGKLFDMAKNSGIDLNAELSEDELEAVSGGRDWVTEGCAATVEEGSDCWSEDGGCWKLDNSYTNLPKGTCPICGKWGLMLDKTEEIKKEGENPFGRYYIYHYHCHYCDYKSTSTIVNS